MYQQMAGCADGKELQISDSPYTWKFQPPESRHAIAATPSPFISTKSPSAALPPPYFWTCFQQTASKYTNPESAAATTEPQPYKREPHDNWVSSRWNPTPEQLQSLEELYRSGVRTPTAKQIQQIAAKLRRFGKIEGKNVFYWFQNHKSRERLKHHRRINLGLKKQRSVQKQSGLTRTDFIVGQANYWASLSTSATSSEESVSLQSAVIAEGNRGIGIKREERERELGQSSSDSRKQQTVNIWQKIEMTDPATTCTTAPVTLLQEVARSQKFSTETQLCNILLKPKHDNAFNQDLLEDERRRESHTLQLFPSPFNDVNIPNVVKKDEAELPILTVNTNLAPIEFYELFPLNSKNKKI